MIKYEFKKRYCTNFLLVNTLLFISQNKIQYEHRYFIPYYKFQSDSAIWYPSIRSSRINWFKFLTSF